MNALVLAGGFGTRMRPLTNHTPKSLLPICNRPFLEHQVRLLAQHGVHDATLLTGYLPEPFVPFAQRCRSLGVTLGVSTEEKPLGTAGAVASVRDRIDGTAIVFNGDVLTDLDLTAMIAHHRATGALVTIALTHVEDARPYGLVPADANGRVEAFLEKDSAEQPGWVNAGTYVIGPGALDGVPPGEFWQFEQHVFPALLDVGAPVFAYRSESYWLDIGNPERYLQAHYDVMSGRARAQVDGRLLTEDVSLPDGTVVAAPTLLSHAAVEPGAILGPLTSIGPDCRIGAGARVERSVLIEGATVGKNAIVRGSIVGPNTPVADGAECVAQVLE
jgi:NDP-sugar pyrophosphorylase family protein